MIRNGNYLLRQVADTWVIVPVGQAAVAFAGMVTLNGTGAYIWELLEQEQTLESLAEALMARFGLQEEPRSKFARAAALADRK